MLLWAQMRGKEKKSRDQNDVKYPTGSDPHQILHPTSDPTLVIVYLFGSWSAILSPDKFRRPQSLLEME